MKISVLLVTTDLPERLHLLDAAIASIDRNDHGFGQKVLSIDFIANEPSDDLVNKLFGKYKDLGWEMVFGRCSGHQGMANNIKRGLGVVNGDIIFYSEDDIVVNRIPASIEEIFSAGVLGKPIGYVCYNTHVHDLANPLTAGPKIGFINNVSNYIQIGGEMFFVKSEKIRDQYYLNAPVMITRTDIFRQLLSYATKSCLGMGMEPALTKAWFDLGYGMIHSVLIYVKPDIFSAMPLDIDKFYHQANMQFWNNTPALRHQSINNRMNTIF